MNLRIYYKHNLNGLRIIYILLGYSFTWVGKDIYEGNCITLLSVLCLGYSTVVFLDYGNIYKPSPFFSY